MIFKVCQYIFGMSLLSPLGKGHGPSILTNMISLHPRMLCAKFGGNWPSGSGEEDENVKSLRQRQRTNFDQKSSLEPLAQVS